MIGGLGVMAVPHTTSMALLVDAFTDWLEWSKRCEKTKAQHADWSQKDRAWTRVMKACAEFGATPSAMSKVTKVQRDEPTGLATIKLA